MKGQLVLIIVVLLGAISTALPPPPAPMQFRDITAGSGIRFSHRSPHTADKFLVETMGSGVAAFDYDADGLVDLFFLNGARTVRTDGKVVAVKSDPAFWNRLYRNVGGGKFADVTESTGLQGSTFAMGVATGDFDNDGWPDLYITGWERNTLYKNDRGKRFVDITDAAGVSTGGWSTGAAFLDYDRDGLLDLFVARYLDWSFEKNPWCGPRETHRRGYCHPNNFGDVYHVLYRNVGEGRFEDVTGKAGIAGHAGKGLGVAIADIDQDGWIDIVVANDSVAQQVFRNNRDGTFSEIGLETGIAYNADGKPFAGMGVDVADYNNDGRPDVFINALSLEGYALFRSAGASLFDPVAEESGLRRVSDPFGGWGTRFADFNNDGWKDLFVAQGHVMDTIAHDNPNLAYLQPMLLLRNIAGKFADVTASAGSALLVPRASRGAAIADFDNDGRVDIAVNNNDGPGLVLKNESVAGSWVAIELVGTKSPRDALGAFIRLTDNTGRKQWQILTTAASYISASQKRAHFGLGDAVSVAEVEVRWPSGGIQVVRNPGVNRVVTIRESQ